MTTVAGDVFTVVDLRRKENDMFICTNTMITTFGTSNCTEEIRRGLYPIHNCIILRRTFNDPKKVDKYVLAEYKGTPDEIDTQIENDLKRFKYAVMSGANSFAFE